MTYHLLGYRLQPLLQSMKAKAYAEKVRSPTAAITVVWGAEYGDCVLLMRPVVPVHDQLVRARYEAQPIVVIELL